MINRKFRFRQILGCILTMGMIIGGINFTMLPVSAENESADAKTDQSEELDISSAAEEGQSGDFGSDRLTGASLDVYNYLKDEIQKTAIGGRPSTVFDVSSLVSTVTEAAEVSQNIEAINSYLMMDCPYELYWYDKSAMDPFPGVDGAISINYNYSGDGSATDVIIRMLVSKEYRPEAADIDDWYYTVDNSRIGTARSIPEKAQAIVDANAGKSDYEKLLAYKNAICDLVVYDEAAAGANYKLSNEPWQLISVFDGDPNTNVVCEGYSKAFQYLCNLSEFDDARCYTVSGGMAGGTGTGAHMWNIVTLEGANYMMDITNCDEGTVGAPDGLFLAIPSKGSWDTQYNFSIGINYKYDSAMNGLFGEGILKLTDKAYGVPANPDTASQPNTTEAPDTVSQPAPASESGTIGQPDTSGNQDTTGQPDASKDSDDSEKADTSKKEESKKPVKEKEKKEDPDISEKTTLGVVSLDPSDKGEYQAVEESITAAYIRKDDELEFVDASEIEDVVKDQLTRKHKLSASDVEVHEIVLEVKNDKGEWETASTDNFPKKGIRITLPYPKGTGKTGYSFYGQHLFTKDMNGYSAGTTEDLEIIKEDQGITFVVHGLSPVTIGWSDENAEENTSDTESESMTSGGAKSGNDTQGTNQSDSKKLSPKTGDSNAVLLCSVLLLLALGTCGVCVKEMRSRKE